MAAVTAARAEARAAMMRRANKAAEIIPPRALPLPKPVDLRIFFPTQSAR